jgi:hypothetical protein
MAELPALMCWLKLRQDQILDEVHRTAVPVHLMSLFGCAFLGVNGRVC